MKNKKIVCFGNSVGIRIRPASEQGKSYGDLFNSNDAFTFDNYCFSGNMIGSVSRNTDLILQKHADIIILQFGVVELSSRSTSRRLYNYLNYAPRKSRLGYIIQSIGLFLESKLRRVLVYLRFKSSWYRSSRFLSEYERTVKSLDLNSSAQIICVGVNQPSMRVEQNLPGTRKRIQSIHSEMERICAKYESSHYVSVLDLVPELIPDGIHYSVEGHNEIYKRILNLIKS
ncbi:MAG: SGNH/GDSL hydrolase family protein [Crocinitomicaceae bacterium]|nr:SGNH/GDSL hydrolase family protein [Crocinitomicaceae bacterium]MDG1777314.1 SGNH/GDSL hydrolase family protein [Crocinitomicaceae bacterium]